MESHCGQLASRRICENAFQGLYQKPRPQSCLQEKYSEYCSTWYSCTKYCAKFFDDDATAITSNKNPRDSQKSPQLYCHVRLYACASSNKSYRNGFSTETRQ